MKIKKRTWALFAVLFLAGQIMIDAAEDNFDSRKSYILNFYSTNYPHAKYWGESDVKTAMGYVLARLALDKETDYALEMIEKMQDEDEFDMFDCHENIDAYFRFGNRYSERLREKVRKKMTQLDYTQNGSTENHKLMFKTAGYLTALAFPEWEKSDSTLLHCQGVLYKMMENMVHYGLKEYDSSTYGTFYITCMLSLYDHSTDAQMRNKAQMTLEWLLLNFAPEWLDGYFVASTLREYEFAASPRLENSYSIIGWLLFGGGPAPVLESYFKKNEIVVNNEGFFVPLVALTTYRVPDIIVNVARDRSFAYVQKESHDMNPYSQLNYPWGFRKYTYVNKEYAFTSQWDGLSLGWSRQMRRWKLTWKSDAPASTFFMTHPCYYEGAGERLMGATAREQVMQHEGTLLAMYKIESGEPYPYVTGVVPVDAVKEIREDTLGWIFFDAGRTLFALRLAHPYQWDADRFFRGVRHRIIRCPKLHTALVVETALAEEYPSDGKNTSFDLFVADLLKNDTFYYDATDIEYATACYITRKGDKLTMKFNRERTVNDIPIDYEAWPLVENPWMEQSVDGRFLTLTYANEVRVYDFKEWKIRN